MSLPQIPGNSNLSPAERLARLPKRFRDEFFDTLTPQEIRALEYDWAGFLRRPNQAPPDDDWFIWLLLAGRGFGKTRTGAEQVIEWAKDPKNSIIHLVGRSAGDVRKVMVEGPSGILKCSPPWFRPVYEPSKTRVVWPNGNVGLTFSSAEPDDLNGPQCMKIWADEPGVWKYPEETWDMMTLGCRLGDDPQIIATTTPKKSQLVKMLIREASILASGGDPRWKIRITKGSTYDNYSNLAESFIHDIVKKYEGTALGRQELWAELLSDDPAALWRREWIDDLRVFRMPCRPERIAIGVDPSGSTGENASECGIVAAALGEDGHGYVLADLSKIDTPGGWGKAIWELSVALGAGTIVAEKNFGGEMVRNVIQGVIPPNAPQPTILLVSAHEGKIARAQPVSNLTEQKQIHHVGTYAELEDEMCLFTGDPKKKEKSPNRLDAMVWALTYLMPDIRPGEWRYGRDGRIL